MRHEKDLHHPLSKEIIEARDSEYGNAILNGLREQIDKKQDKKDKSIGNPEKRPVRL